MLCMNEAAVREHRVEAKRVWTNGLVLLSPSAPPEFTPAEQWMTGADFGLPEPIYRAPGQFLRNIDDRTEYLINRLKDAWFKSQASDVSGPAVAYIPNAKKKVYDYIASRLGRDGITTTVIQPGEAVSVQTPPTLHYHGDYGPFDIVGDIHGCINEFNALAIKLGYQVDVTGLPVLRHPEGRQMVLTGDLVDKGPNPVEVLELAVASYEAGSMLWVKGNHDYRLQQCLTHGKRYPAGPQYGHTLEALSKVSHDFRARLLSCLEELPSHVVLAEGKLVVAHACIDIDKLGSMAPSMEKLCMFGETTGRQTSDGFPERLDWTRDYQGEPLVVFGHVADDMVRFTGNTVCVDTGCFQSGTLSAFRWPEREVVQVSAPHKVAA